MDAFAVSIAAGASLDRVTPRHVFRMAFHFGLFQFGMPVLGWWAGSTIAGYIAAYDHWLAFGLLSAVGGKMWWNALRGAEEASATDPTRGWLLVALSVATSIDALAVGFGMALMSVGVFVPCLVIGLVAAGFSTVGITCGGKMLRKWGRPAQVMGACALILIGVRILVSHSQATM